MRGQAAKTIEEAGHTATQLVTTQDRLLSFWHHYRQHQPGHGPGSARQTNRNANTHFPRTESCSRPVVLSSLMTIVWQVPASWTGTDLPPDQWLDFIKLFHLEDYLNDSVNSVEQCPPPLPCLPYLPLISIDISPPCFSSKSTLISLINRPHYGQDCQKYFYLPRNILYCVNISLCLYFLWLSITATTNVSSAYKSIVLPLTK